MINKKIKIGLLSIIGIATLFFLWFINYYVVDGINCKNEKVNVVLYKEKYYEYDFPFDFIPFCGELKTWKMNKFYVSKLKFGKLNGERKIYYNNKQLSIVANFKRGKLNGKFLGWYENGKKAIETFYINDLENGQRIEWYKNGAPKSVGHYKEGKKNGEFITWYDKGSMSKDEWKKNSSHKTISMFKNDVEQTSKITFDKHGKIILDK